MEDCQYPYKELSGCGVGFKLLQAFCEKFGYDPDLLYDYIDLVAVSIAADIVPITGENRVLAYHGLKKLNENPRLGLNALIKLAGIRNDVNISSIVFGIGPRINASGRMDHAKSAVDLLLADNFKNLGGELKLKSMVEKIITQDGAAVGVVCKGKEYPADYVLSASDYKKTFLKLLDDRSLLPEGFENKVQEAAVSEGFFTVYLGLNLPGEKLREYMKLPHVMYYDLKVGYDLYDSNDKDFFEKCSLWLYSTSMLHEGNAPAGKSSLMIQSPVPLHWMNNWGNGDRKLYKQLKEKAMDTLIKRASAVIPKIEKYIEFQDAATPLTYERYTHNTDGATSAWSWNPNKWFYKDGYNIRVTTPVKNLLICSCWAHQMGGIPTAIQAPQKCAELIR